MAIDISNINFINYLWTKKNDDNTISGIRLSKDNLPTDTAYISDIPAVNNGTLTIQKNGTTVQTFTANQSSNITANITVPTKTSDIDNDSGFLTAHQSIKVLNTNNNSKLNVASETISGSGSISLNGISKTAQEEYLQWGGPAKSGSVSPIGMTLSNEHSANRMAFINGDLITAEYSSDGGTTWTEYSANAAAKSQFFTKSYTFAVGRPNESTEVTADKSKTRITITAQNGNNPSGRVYTDPRKMLVLISSATGLELLAEYRTGTNYKNNGAWATFGTYSLSGWSGWNDIPLVLNTIGGGSTQTGNNWQLRLTFTVKTKSASYPKTASVLAARIYGQNTWTTPSTMAETGHMYTFDMSKNVTFPAGVSATSFTEGGTSLANKYLGKTAKAADADKLDGHDSTYYLNLDNINDGSTRKLANYVPKSLTSTKGDMIYASAANTPARLGIGSNGQFLSIADGIPKWVNNPNTHNSHAIISGTKSDGSTQIKGSASSSDITLGDSGVTAGTYRSVTVNSKGIVVAGSQTDNDTNTWRKIQLDGIDKLGTGINTNPLNIKAGNNMTITESNGTFTFDATDTDTHYINYLQIKGNDTEAVKFTQNANKSLNLKPGSNVSISAASGEITISSTDTNTSHSHSAGVGLVGSGNAGTSGTYDYKAKLRSETALTVDSVAATTTSGRVYPVVVDKSGYLSVNVPWTNTTYTFNGAVSTIKDSNLTTNRALISNGNGKVAVSDITSTELSYLDGVNSNIQTQLNTLKGYFNENGYALIAVSASHDADGNEITTTYANQVDLDNTNTIVSALKTKLDGIETGANKIIVDTALSSTSTNPVQNKALYTALNFKADEQLPMEITTTEGDSFRSVGDAIVGINDAMLIMASEIPNYSSATSSSLGLVKLGSDTVQSTAANSVTSTSSRTYAVQKNSNGQLVVNVPWTTSSAGLPSDLAKIVGSASNYIKIERYGLTTYGMRIQTGKVSVNKAETIHTEVKFPKPDLFSNTPVVILTPVINNTTDTRSIDTELTGVTNEGFHFSCALGNTSYRITEVHYIAIQLI